MHEEIALWLENGRPFNRIERMKRWVSVVVAAACIGGSGATPLLPRASFAGETAPASVPVEASCETAKDVGRVKCTVGLANAGVEWADLSVVAVPDGVSALRARLALDEAERRDPSRATWSVALVAKRAVKGDVRFRVRTVVCTKPGTCTPHTFDVSATLSAGQ